MESNHEFYRGNTFTVDSDCDYGNMSADSVAEHSPMLQWLKRIGRNAESIRKIGMV
ncbi:hypothetical protein VTJ04DRAFT_9343 [Mycothermus thermophilus]|uniref:uncharacterized protein n=1 Tax=Humicola insolens TaxID=85995 RepID=UPI003743067D